MSSSQPPPPTGPPIPGPDLLKSPPVPSAPSPAPAGPGSGAAVWRPWTAWVAMVSGLGVTLIVGVVVAVIAVAAGADSSAKDFPPGVNIALTLFQNLAFFGAAFFFARMVGGRPRAEDFGLVLPRIGKALGLLLAVWFTFYALSTIWALALHLKDETQELPEQLGAGDSLINTLLVVFLITMVAPLGEELFFRGYFFRALRNWRGLVPAALLTGAVFGGIHAGSSPPAFLVPLAFFGVGLCLLYHWTGSLLPCIALHALNNSVALGVALHWSWEIPVTMVVSVCVTLSIAWWIGRLLGRRDGAAAPARAPSTGPSERNLLA